MIEKKAITSMPINEILSKRWSIRAFDINKKVSKENILAICEAARWAPSCFNDQPYRFMVWDKYEDEANYNKAFSCLVEWNQRWVRTAPVLICVLADNKFRHNGEPNRWAQFDAGAATQNLYLQAVDLGMMAHPMGGFDVDKIKKEFNIPENFTPMAMIAVGYQSENIDVLDNDHKELETKPRERISLGENFFFGEWGTPITKII